MAALAISEFSDDSLATPGESRPRVGLDLNDTGPTTTSSITFSAMGTTVHIVIVGGDRSLLGSAQELVEQLESKWSRFRFDSEVSRINRAQGNPCVVSQETYDLVSQSIAAWSASGGAFDPTVETCMQAAGYSRPFDELPMPNRFEAGSSPTSDSIPAPTPAGIYINPTTRLVQLPIGTTIDLGGIAKGATADLVATQLLAQGAVGCCVNVGGDIRALGEPPRNAGWLISLDVANAKLPALALKAGSVCTSTTRFRRWQGSSGGVEHHIRNPKNGQAATTDVESAVVIAERATQAEVLAKMVLLGGSSLTGSIFERSNTTGFAVLTDGSTFAAEGTQEFIMGGR